MIKAILFDFGDVLLKSKLKGVIIEDTVKEVAKALKVSYDTFETIRKEYHQDLRKGKISFSDFSKILKRKLNLSLKPNEINRIWSQCYLKISKPNQVLFELAEKLKNNYKVGLISNIYDLTVEIDKERGLFKIFEPCILSSEVGLGKPQKEIFELALQKLNLKGEECVFIDNKEKYLEIAKKLGFKTILFKNNQQLVKDLKSLGLNI